MAEGGTPSRALRLGAARARASLSSPRAQGGIVTTTAACPGGGAGVSVAESAPDPPGPIPNPVVKRRSAGEYHGGDPLGGEAAADTPAPHLGPARTNHPPRGGAAAARWAHNPKVGGSNPPPATSVIWPSAPTHHRVGADGH